jgi:long-chain acyl-CoA synthetase
MENVNDIKYTKRLEDFIKEDKSQYPDTLCALLEDCARKYGDRPAIGKAGERPISYKEMWERVLRISNLLIERGLNKGDRVAILGENSPNWGISYFAAIEAGAIAVPILPDFPESDILHIISDSEAKILFTTYKQLERLSDLDNTRIKSVIMLDDFNSETHKTRMESISDIFEKAKDFFKKFQESMGLICRDASENDVASIIYTSGTSGHSKAVMLTHRNLVSNVVAISRLTHVNADSVMLSVLPLSHCYEFTIGFLLALLRGARVVYLSKPPTPRVLEDVCKIVKPTVICAVPLILEKIYKKKVLPVLEKNLPVRLITTIPFIKKGIYKKINKKLLEFFGGRLKIMAVGGASFNRKAEKFFNAAGFPYLVGYGLTETSPLICGGPEWDKSIKVSSTGKVTPGCEIKIVDADKKTGIGEIYARGPNIMKGYYKNPEMTAEVLDKDGWLKTGDLGYFDKLDNLHIKGRSKNVIVMSSGENIYPETIEEKINASQYAMESLVIENNNQLEAWIYLDYELIDTETKNKNETQRYEYIQEKLTQLKDIINEQLPVYSKLSRIYEQKEPFEKTPTHKIKRYLYEHHLKKK